MIIGPGTVMMYKDVYPLLLKKVLRIGVWMVVFNNQKTGPRGDWYATLNPKRPEKKKMKLTKTYNPDDYPRFDNAPDIIESKSKDIPIDYPGLIAVPISFFKYYDYLPYDILELRTDLKLNGKDKFARLIIRRKQL